MTEYGVTTTGFVIKRLAIIKAEIETALKSATSWGTAVNLSADGPLGQLIGLFAEREALIWELAQAVYDAMYPDSAAGAALDNVCAMIGVERRSSSRSVVTLTCTGTPGTTIGVDKYISTVPGSNRFYTSVASVIGVGGTVEVVCYSDELGPIAASANTLTDIITKVTGWTSCANAKDAVLGDDTEIDYNLRLRRLQSLQVGGKSTVGGMYANLLQNIDGVEQVSVIENDTDSIDSDGRPPHSIECVVKGGDDTEIAELIWSLKPAGIQTCGTSDDVVTETVTDDEGYGHDVTFSRPSDINIWVHIEINVDGSEFNVGSDQKVKVKILLNTGTDYDLSIQSTDFSYTKVALDTKADIAAGVASAINSGDWVPATATYPAGEDYFWLESDFEGNAFSVVIDDDTLMEVVDDTPNTGDAIAVVANVLAYAEANQTIGKDVVISRYFTPVNEASDGIVSITVRLSKTRWSPAPSGGESNIDIARSENGDLGTTRTTVEVTSV